MRAPTGEELLRIWERCRAHHPIDRALLFCAFRLPQLPALPLADQPLGTINRHLLQLHLAWFGPQIAVGVGCPACGEQLELSLEAQLLLDDLGVPSEQPNQLSDGFTVRALTSRDLAAVSHCPDAASAARALLERCLSTADDQPMPRLSSLPVERIEALEDVLESLDPAADIGLDMACEACGHGWVAGLDIGDLLWDKVRFRARSLLAEVDTLARAYGWSESDILALTPQRRASYLELVRS